MSIEPGNRGSRLWVLGFWVLVLGSGFFGSGVAAQGSQGRRILSCDGPFAPTMTPQSLAAEFGAANVTTEDIGVGEGFFEKGTVLFSKSPQDRLEIHWHDEKVQHTPRVIVVRAEKCRWKTADGLTIGINLRTLERLNRRPFRLSGFAWDGGGGVRNWSGGVLDRQPAQACQVSATLAPLQNADGSIPNEKVFHQVLGERQYSSGHPAMQTLNPAVSALYVVYLSQKR